MQVGSISAVGTGALQALATLRDIGAARKAASAVAGKGESQKAAETKAAETKAAEAKATETKAADKKSGAEGPRELRAASAQLQSYEASLNALRPKRQGDDSKTKTQGTESGSTLAVGAGASAKGGKDTRAPAATAQKAADTYAKVEQAAVKSAG